MEFNFVDTETGELLTGNPMGLSTVIRLQQKTATHRADLSYSVYFNGCNAIRVPRIQHKKEKEMDDNHLKTLKNSKKFDGTLSKHSVSKIKRLIGIWSDHIALNNITRSNLFKYQKRTLVLLTLTLSAETKLTDNEVKRELLNTFLIYSFRKWGKFNYIWKLEKQKNGRAHFHLLIDTYIDKEEVNIMWNKVQMQKNIIPKSNLIESVKKYPSTKIEAVKSIDRGANYMVKYITKQEEEVLCDGRLWGCNRELSKLESFEYEHTDSFFNLLLTRYHAKKVWQHEEIPLSIWNLGKNFKREDLLKTISNSQYLDTNYYYTMYQKTFLSDISPDNDVTINDDVAFIKKIGEFDLNYN
jgi:hypothetical protein